MRVMVTGGTGFVGSHTVRRFLAAGHRVRMLVRDAVKVRQVFDPFDLGFSESDIVVGDITDGASVERAMQGCDAVFHGAALVDMRRSMATQVLEVNRKGVELVVGGAARRGLPAIVYVSSISVFFAPNCGPLNVNMPITADTTAYANAYAKSKAQAERVIRRLQNEGAPIRVSYPVGIVGPNDPGLGGANQAVYIFLKQTGLLTSSGFQIVDVRDLADLHLVLLEQPEGSSRYAAAGSMHSWSETYRLIDEVTGKWTRRFPVPGPLLRSLGTIGDIIKSGYDFSFPLTRDAMEFATRWPDCSAEQTTNELGISFRSARETYADTLRWMYEAGHLKARHVGNIARQKS